MTWMMTVNLVVWTGLFLYLLRLHRQLRRLERSAAVGTTNRPAGEETGR